MALSKNDLLYAHGSLCAYASDDSFHRKEDAERLCEVLNNFEVELKEHLTHQQNFRVLKVQPCGCDCPQGHPHVYFIVLPS